MAKRRITSRQKSARRKNIAVARLAKKKGGGNTFTVTSKGSHISGGLFEKGKTLKMKKSKFVTRLTKSWKDMGLIR